MPVKRNRSRLLAIASQVYRSRIEVIHPAPDCFVNQPVDLILVDHLATVSIILQRPAHTAISEKPYARIVGRHTAPAFRVRIAPYPRVRAGCQSQSGCSARYRFQEMSSIHMITAFGYQQKLHLSDAPGTDARKLRSLCTAPP